MKIFANKDIKHFFIAVTLIPAVSFFLAEAFIWTKYKEFSVWMLLLCILTIASIWVSALVYFHRENRLMENAVALINSYLDGNADTRIECDEEGELYKLFHSVNSLAVTLNAHATGESQEKEFLKNTISDISHQLKTPLAALNIYNGLLQDETDIDSVKEFATLSEQELDRIETLVQNLLKITRLDAGSIIFEKAEENISDMMHDIYLHFAYRAEQENKKITLEGPDNIHLLCDRGWLIEAISNIVKNALDHTSDGDSINITWQAFPDSIRISVKDTGCGIHPEDLHYIFKRFYRSRFSKEKQGIGLGLPLAKAIIEAHNGIIEVDSIPGSGTTFSMIFLR